MAKKQKKELPIDDFFNIDNFKLEAQLNEDIEPNSFELVDANKEPIEEIQQGPATTDSSAFIKEQLDKLILHDIDILQNASVKPIVQPIQAEPSKHQHVPTPEVNTSELPKNRRIASHHVIDLRKHYLIEKNRLDVLDRPRNSYTNPPRRSFFKFATKQRIEWHVPKKSEFKKPVTVAPQERIAQIVPIEKKTQNTPTLPVHFNYGSLALFTMILLIVIFPIPGVSMLGDLLSQKNEFLDSSKLALTSLKAGVNDVKNSQFDQAQEQFSTAGKDFAQLQTRLNGFNSALMNIITIIPGFHSKVDLVNSVSSIGQHTSAIGSLLSTSLNQKNESRHMTDTIKDLSYHFDQIHSALQSSRSSIKSLDPQDVPAEWRDTVIDLRDHIDEIINDTQRISTILDVVYSFAGGSSFSRHLVLFQNNRELRPTGGFIGSYALMDFTKGSLTDLEFPGGGIYDLTAGFKQHLIPPKPISILNMEWNIWDANWWPDFPTSAKKIAWFYNKSGGPTIDGVIAVNSDMMIDILKLTGPVSLPQYNVIIDENNFYQLIQTEVELTYDKKLNQPKKILKDLFPILLDRIVQSQNLQSSLTLLTHALATKQVQMSIFDDAVQTKIKSLGWDGRVVDTPKDYLQVVSTNIAGGKSSASIYETIDHQAQIKSDGTVVVTTKITKENRAQPDDVFAYLNNVDYIRTYVPLGSKLIESSGFNPPDESLFNAPSDMQLPDKDLEAISGRSAIDQRSGTEIYSEFNHTVFANWMQVKPGESTSAYFIYELPFKIVLPDSTGVNWLSYWKNESYKEVDGYSLFVQKQSGKNNVLINSTVTLPDSKTIVWYDAVDIENAGALDTVFRYSTPLEYDTYYAFLISQRKP